MLNDTAFNYISNYIKHFKIVQLEAKIMPVPLNEINLIMCLCVHLSLFTYLKYIHQQYPCKNEHVNHVVIFLTLNKEN